MHSVPSEDYGDENGPFGPQDDTTFLAETLEQGKRAVRELRRFAGRLPEVDRRESYLKKGRTDVHDFAAHYGGMRRDHVNEVLRVDRFLRHLPKLRAMLHRGEQGWSKLRAVVTLARPDTEDYWVEEVRHSTKRELELFVSDVKAGRCREVGPDGVPRPGPRPTRQEVDADEDACDFLVSESGAPVEARPPRDNRTSLKFDSVTAELLVRLARELGKKEKRRVSHDEALRRLLSCKGNLKAGRLPVRLVIHREEPGGSMYVRTADGRVPVTQAELDAQYEIEEEVDLIRDAPPARRYEPRRDGRRPKVPEPIRRHVMDLKYDGRCGFGDCHRRATELHHPERFTVNPTHDPATLVAVCRGHHAMIHRGRVADETVDPRDYQVTLAPALQGAAARVDRIVQRHRLPGKAGGQD